MPRPGSDTIQSTSPPVRTASTDVSAWLVTGFTERGPIGPKLIGSIAELIQIFGNRVTYSPLYDALDLYFHESRGAKAYVSRVVGPNPVKASLNLLDRAAAVSLRATAKEYGAWGDRLRIEVVAGTGGAYNLQVLLDGLLVEEFDGLRTQQDAVDVSELSSYIDFAIGASVNVPIPAAVAPLAGGDDDHANATATEDEDARALFTKDLGPGQISAPGRTDDATHINLLAHAALNGRVALLDLPDSPLAATLKTSAAAPTVNTQFGAAFAPWITIPGIINGTTRTAPASGLVAAKIALTDQIAQINQPAAGLEYGVSSWALGLSQTFTDAEFTDLALNGVNMITNLNNNIVIFGWRSLVDPAVDDTWLNFANSRLYMEIAAKVNWTALTHAFKMMDGGGLELGKLYKDLVGDLLPYFGDGSLFGETPQEAFIVDLSGNTPATMANRELHAKIGVRMSEFAEYVVIDIVKIPLTESLV